MVRLLPVVSLRACKQTSRFLRSKQKKRKGSPPHSQREKAVANKERIYNSHLGLLRSERWLLDTTQLTRHVVRPTSLCHHLSGPEHFGALQGRSFRLPDSWEVTSTTPSYAGG